MFNNITTPKLLCVDILLHLLDKMSHYDEVLREKKASELAIEGAGGVRGEGGGGPIVKKNPQMGVGGGAHCLNKTLKLSAQWECLLWNVLFFF